MRKLLLSGLALLFFVLLLPAQKGSADEETIRKLEMEWSAAAQNKNLEKVMSYYAESAVALPYKAPKATTKAEIRDSWRELMGAGSVQWQPVTVEVAKGKDLGYSMGTYERKMKDAQGNEATETGKYVEVWKKQSDKQWKVVADIYNPDK
jgi:ketosteroid isomerase-like protein